MTQKVLTVSIAAYNVAQFLEQTLESLILPPAYMERMDVVIVDDGSCDQTAVIAQTYVDQYPSVFRLIQKPNGGYGSTINASLPVARGKYYKLLDGDDWYHPENLWGFLDFLSQADADLVVSPYYEVTNGYRCIDRHGNGTSDAISMHEIAVRTQLLQERNVRITENCFYTDTEFLCECFLATKTIARYENPVYCYRLGLEGQSVSLSGLRKHFRDMVTVSNKLYALFSQCGGDAAGQQKGMLERALADITHNTYRAYMLLEQPRRYKQELITHDKHIRERYPAIYEISMCSKTVKLLRLLHFRFYGLCCKWVLGNVDPNRGKRHG